MTHEELARKIAADLFTDGAGNHAERLVMDYTGHAGGTGWCFEAVVDRIAAALKARDVPEGIERFTPDDEVVGFGHFHIEAMSDGMYWMRLAGQDFHIASATGKAKLTFRSTEAAESARDGGTKATPPTEGGTR